MYSLMDQAFEKFGIDVEMKSVIDLPSFFVFLGVLETQLIFF